MNENRTIAAIATPAAAGGIGIIRISGQSAFEIADKVFSAKDSSPLSSAKGYTMKYGGVYDGNELIDEAVALVYRAPRSYTGEDVIELSCHGGIYVLNRVLRRCIECGASPASPGEFTKRAFLNGKLDLTQAQAVMDIVSAQGEQAAKGAAAAKDGAISRRIAEIKAPLVELSAHMGVWSDYPDDDLPELTDDMIEEKLLDAQRKLQALLKSFDAGKILCTGISTAIIGKPNVGKSTLMNLMAKAERSIVTSVAGTTRDIVEESVRLGKLILRLADTAGIHETADEVEKIGVERACERMKNSDLVIAVFDSSKELDGDDLAVLELVAGCRSVAVINKTDLEQKLDISALEGRFSKLVYMSAKTDEDCSALENAAQELFELNDYDTSSGIINNERQRACCVRALE
ncbi:MAG: tRNA uridine-5-carboxymethylaminomethyl(34) synthesis GTPase MnmE, partial [Clostridia bacterium]|nr:tRNA uridine-5-carboxymethylaminomethyl(34) synthesis GTPase MnmE [Clostridia bacterium]